nr:MAG TPA: toxin [Caudoviricetes sp.]
MNCMDIIVSIFIAVVSGVICHYIIKWLDGNK